MKFFWLSLTLMCTSFNAWSNTSTGEATYTQVCAACHAQGAQHAALVELFLVGWT